MSVMIRAAAQPRWAARASSARISAMDSLAARSDAELVALTRRGQPDAYGELVRRHQTGVYNIAYRLVGEKQEALDLTQEAFLRAYAALASFDPTRPFAPWIHRIVTNLTLNQLEHRRVPTVPLSGPEDIPASEPPLPDPSADPERVYLAGEQQAAVHRAILRLPPRYRLVIELRHFQELSYAEIAATLGIPESDVKSHLFRARQLLREYLKNVFSINP